MNFIKKMYFRDSFGNRITWLDYYEAFKTYKGFAVSNWLLLISSCLVIAFGSNTTLIIAGVIYPITFLTNMGFVAKTIDDVRVMEYFESLTKNLEKFIAKYEEESRENGTSEP